MSFITHKIITVILLIFAGLTLAFSFYYQDVYPSKSVIANKTWNVKHRGYPNQFGYLTHHWGLRIVETNIDAEIHHDNLTTAMEFKLFDQNGPFAQLTIQYDSEWSISNDLISFHVDKDSARVTQYSEGFDLEIFEPYLIDLLHDMFSAPRQVISISANEVILEIPYLGIVRAVTIPESTLIKE